MKQFMIGDNNYPLNYPSFHFILQEDILYAIHNSEQNPNIEFAFEVVKIGNGEIQNVNQNQIPVDFNTLVHNK